MKYFNIQILVATLAVGLGSVCFAQSGEEVEDWYQIEVVIFSQQDFYKAEIPRRDTILSYPDNWIELQDPAELEQKDEVSNELPLAPGNANSLSQLTAVMNNQAELETESPTPTVTEIPYLWLDKEERTLNPDAFSLTRAPGYRVLYHQAWRQPIANRGEAPWIIIKGGRSFGERYELEGSLRLYQSRFLHFQSNLWKARYQEALVRRPILPLDESQLDLAVTEEITVDPWPVIPEPPEPIEEPQEITHPDQLLIENTPREALASIAATEQGPFFEVTEVVSLKQSQRVSAGQMYYLDHPNMGVLVLVKKYQPVAEELVE